jgi:branched-chain amino acid transport system permease protein
VVWVNQIVQGILLGGLYALFATGLSLVFGVMRLVNLAHGDLIVLASFLSLVLVHNLGWNPLTTLVLLIPIMALLGFALQYALLNFTLDSELTPILATFGLSVIIQKALLEQCSADSQKLEPGRIESESIRSSDPISSGGFALITSSSRPPARQPSALIRHTGLGAAARDARRPAHRSSSDRQPPALRHRHGDSARDRRDRGVFLGVYTSFGPSSGPARLIFGFEAVIIGGLGSLWGTLAGGIVLGVSQAIGAQISIGWGDLAGHLVFLVILLVRPRGLFPGPDR